MPAWNQANILSLQNGAYVSFGNRTELNNASKLSGVVLVRYAGTGWFAGSRALVTRTGQFSVRVMPYGGNLINIGIAPSPTGSMIFKGMPDTPANRAMLNGKVCHLIGWTFDAGTIRLWVDGIEVDVSGAGSVPVKLTSVSGPANDLRLGSTDKLSASAGNLALWIGTVLNPEQMAGLWNRGRIPDLASGFADGPLGESVSIPFPMWWWPCTADVLPNVAPGVGDIAGAVIPGTGGTPAVADANVPISPYSEGDAVADFRFAIKSGFEGFDPEPYYMAPALLRLPNGNMLAAWSRSSGHTVPNQDIYSAICRNDGRAWPYPMGRAWPGSLDGVQKIVDSDSVHSAKGSSLQVTPSGRILHFFNSRLGSGLPPPGQLERYLMVQHSDDGGAAWSLPRDTAHIGTQWTSIAAGGTMLVRSDGTLCKAVYYRNFVPGTTEAEACYSCALMLSNDDGMTWRGGETIVDGALSGLQFEEPQLERLTRMCPGSPNGEGWACIMRVDYPSPARLFVAYSPGCSEGRVWTSPAFVTHGWNTPVWHEGPDCALLMTRHADPSGVQENGKSVMKWSKDGLQTWSPEVELGRAGDQANMHHSFFFNPDGTVNALVAHAHGPGTGTSTVLEFLRIKRLW